MNLFLNYELIQGARSDSKLLYVINEKLLYRKNVSTKKFDVYWCLDIDCKSTLEIDSVLMSKIRLVIITIKILW
jgi:hypothetical protein